MDKELLDKIRSVLEESGIEEEVIAKVEGKLSEETEGEETPDEPVSEKPATPESEEDKEEDVKPSEGEVTPSASDVPAEEGEPVSPSPVEEEVGEPAPAEDLPPVPEGEPLPEGVEEVQVGEGLPAVEDAPVVPQNAEEVESLRHDIEEYKKANEGLLSRIESLEGALKEAGIISETSSSKTVGVDDGTRTPDYHDDEADLDAILDKFNKNHY